ncbi:MAG: pyruvate kinase [bacterium]|nr:pyruvate kinase [bacterium]
MRNTSNTQIIATIGPASRNESVIREMAQCHMDLARLNFSHGTHKEHETSFRWVRKIAEELGKRILIIQDLSGPRDEDIRGHHFHEGSVIAITEKDKKDLAFGLKLGVNYVALSYVGNADDVLALKRLMEKNGIERPVIAKIERSEAVKNINAIIEVADAVMVARGDLGLSLPPEKVPFIQDMIIKKCNHAGKSVITATQMLYSMVHEKTPTRAEVSDVAHAIMAGSDAVMLSEETAIGEYPVEAVAMMERIIVEAEAHLGKSRAHHPL